jgi:EAL domain-containing protein (putative c-di-GMP-specific phosphodiesterase class I)
MRFESLCFLIAEDHDFQRKAVARMLESLGARCVHQAADGHAALAILSSGTPVDIAISDLDMPGMDGMEFIRRLGESGTRVSLIIASALDPNLVASVAAMTKAYGVMLLGVIEKPLTPGKLEPLLKLHHLAQARPSEPPAAKVPAFTVEEIDNGLKAGQFEPFFHPKIELATGRVKGAEALARWRHPEYGIVAPYAFIPLLEATSLIDDLTWVMLERSAACCREWRTAGLDVNVCVNLSLTSLTDVRLADRITEIVAATRVEPRHVVLEVTESAATTDVGKALENLARLRMKGFGLSIDDYGTGYSTMQQLTRIPFTDLKIDQSFVRNAHQPAARVILESSLGMAKKLGITAVAEGVETQEDWDLLRQLGCDLAQGYFVTRPLDAASYVDWMTHWRQMK